MTIFTANVKKTTETKIVNKHNLLKSPTGKMQASWLFTKRDFGLPIAPPATGHNGIRTYDLSISSPAL